jgi:hypothetical protein
LFIMNRESESYVYAVLFKTLFSLQRPKEGGKKKQIFIYAFLIFVKH